MLQVKTVEEATDRLGVACQRCPRALPRRTAWIANIEKRMKRREKRELK